MRSTVLGSALLSLCGVGAALAQSPCDRLKSLALPDTTITVAEAMPAGLFKAPGQGPAPGAQGPPAPAIVLPAYCRVAAVLKPTPDSNIEIEVWLPATEWNGKFQAVGNGGWAGIISYPAMAAAVHEGYATASTDTGHKGADATFAPGHPEKVIDFSYRSVHSMTVTAKALIAAFYGKNPRLSYWNGCSTGGRQGLMSAQKYPEDFDAILAGAPANYENHLHAFDMSLGTAIRKEPGSFLPAPKLALLNNAVIKACDTLDGVKDGLLSDPRKCKFDPATLLCRAGDNETCLTAPQVEAVKKAYAPAQTKSGVLIYPGYAPGSEAGWTMLTGASPDPAPVALGTYRYVLHEDPNWDWRNFDLDRDVAEVDKKAGHLNAIEPNLQAFKARGGKLLMYHGWNDVAISPLNSINYYSSVLAKMGSGQDNWLRLFMVPGMGHCRGGPGPNQANFLAALERWRESGTAPEQITAYHTANNNVEMSRPLCPYPKMAIWSGVGSTNDAANFVCKAP
jgi:feruloyl esterase